MDYNMKYLNDDDLLFCIAFNKQWLDENKQLDQLEIYKQVKRENRALQTKLDKRNKIK